MRTIHLILLISAIVICGSNLSIAQEIASEKNIFVLPNTLTETKILIRNDFNERKTFEIKCFSKLNVTCPKNIEIGARSFNKLNITVYSKEIGTYDLKIMIENKTNELKIKVTNLQTYLKTAINYYENLNEVLNYENYEIKGIEKLNETKELFGLGLYSEAARKLDEFVNSFSIVKKEKSLSEKTRKRKIFNLLLIAFLLVFIVFLFSLFKNYHKRVRFRSTLLKDLERIKSEIGKTGVKIEMLKIPKNLPEDKRKLVEKYLKEKKYELAKLLLR